MRVINALNETYSTNLIKQSDLKFKFYVAVDKFEEKFAIMA